MSGAVVLQASGLRCDIGGRTILEAVDLQVRTGERVGVVGPNGSGKSTLLRTLAGLRTPADGTVLLDGRPIHAMRGRARARAIAMVAQEEAPAAELLVGELVALGLTPHRKPWSGGGQAERAAVAEALALVDLAGYERRPVDRLSGGERRRALLARGLAQGAPLLVLDEPTNHLDVRHQLDLLARLTALRRTLVVSLHDLDLALRWCDRVVVLGDGRIRAFGPPTGVLTPALVADVFGVGAEVVHSTADGTPHLLLHPHTPPSDPTTTTGDALAQEAHP